MLTAYLNPGHSSQYEIDHADGEPGACAHGMRECDIALGVVDYLEAFLDQFGVEVLGTMQSDELTDVVDAANDSGADIFVSVHCNAAANPEAEGTETLFCEGEGDDQELAECINASIVERIGTEDRGSKPDTASAVGSLYVLRQTNMPAVLVELAFLTNENEALLLKYRQKDFAEAIALGILKWAGIEEPAGQEVPCEEDGQLVPDDDIAVLARRYESNGDPGAVSSGIGDLGGRSYGLYQLSSNVGAADDFVRWLCNYPVPELANYGRVLSENTVNSQAFIDQWQSLAAVDPENFGQLQDEYIQSQYYDRAASLLDQEGYHVDAHSRAMRAVIFARAIQNGPAGCLELMIHAVDDVSDGNGWNLSYVDDVYFDKAMITAVYDFLVRECDYASPDEDGIWRSPDGFCNGGKSVMFGLRSRFLRERADALALLGE